MKSSSVTTCGGSTFVTFSACLTSVNSTSVNLHLMFMKLVAGVKTLVAKIALTISCLIRSMFSCVFQSKSILKPNTFLSSLRNIASFLNLLLLCVILLWSVAFAVDLNRALWPMRSLRVATLLTSIWADVAFIQGSERGPFRMPFFAVDKSVFGARYSFTAFVTNEHASVMSNLMMIVSRG